MNPCCDVPEELMYRLEFGMALVEKASGLIEATVSTTMDLVELERTLRLPREIGSQDIRHIRTIREKARPLLSRRPQGIRLGCT